MGGGGWLIELCGGKASGCVVADDCAGGAFVAVATDGPGWGLGSRSAGDEGAVVQAKARTAIAQAMNNVDLTLLSPYGGDVVSYDVVIGRGRVVLRGAEPQIIAAVSFVDWKQAWSMRVAALMA